MYTDELECRGLLRSLISLAITWRRKPWVLSSIVSNSVIQKLLWSRSWTKRFHPNIPIWDFFELKVFMNCRNLFLIYNTNLPDSWVSFSLKCDYMKNQNKQDLHCLTRTTPNLFLVWEKVFNSLTFTGIEGLPVNFHRSATLGSLKDILVSIFALFLSCCLFIRVLKIEFFFLLLSACFILYI